MNVNQNPEENPAEAETEPEKEWWEEPGMPWNKKPGKADYWCLGWLGFIIAGMAMIPLRAAAPRPKIHQSCWH